MIAGEVFALAAVHQEVLSHTRCGGHSYPPTTIQYRLVLDTEMRSLLPARSCYERLRAPTCLRVPESRRHMSAVKIHSLRIEEQTLFNYAKKKYYPVHPSELFHDRYRTIAKLGWGAYSTVWLTRDERLERRLCKSPPWTDPTTDQEVIPASKCVCQR